MVRLTGLTCLLCLPIAANGVNVRCMWSRSGPSGINRPIWARGVGFSHRPTAWIVGMRWAEWSAVVCPAHQDQEQGLPDRWFPVHRVPLIPGAVSVVPAGGEQILSSARVRSYIVPVEGTVQELVPSPFPSSSDDAICPVRGCGSAWTCSYVSTPRLLGRRQAFCGGKQAFRLPSCRLSRFLAANQRKGAPCSLATQS